MPSPIQYPYTGGNRQSSASAKLKIALPGGTIDYAGWTKISYSWELKPVKVRGNHPDPIGQTLGIAEYEASWEVYLAEYNYLLSIIGGGFATTYFTFTVAHSENGFDTVVDTIQGVRLVKGEASIEAPSADPQKRTLELSPLKIYVNGLDPLAIPLQGALGAPLLSLTTTLGISI